MRRFFRTIWLIVWPPKAEDDAWIPVQMDEGWGFVLKPEYLDPR